MGSLGRVLSERLRHRGYPVVQCGRNVPIDSEHIQIDVSDYSQTLAAIASIRPSIIVHLAASYNNEFDPAFAINVLGAKNLLAALKETSTPARVVLAGSAAEYGLVSASENPIGVQRVLRPVSIYGLTKSWQTNWGLLCAHEGQDVVIARIFNLYGSEMSQRLFVGRVQQQNSTNSFRHAKDRRSWFAGCLQGLHLCRRCQRPDSRDNRKRSMWQYLSCGKRPASHNA